MRDANAWIDLEVHVQTGLQLEEIHRLRDLHPGFVHIRPVLPAQDRAEEESAGAVDAPSMGELFSRFFSERNGVVPDDALVQLFLEMVAEVDADPDALDEPPADEESEGVGA